MNVIKLLCAFLKKIKTAVHKLCRKQYVNKMRKGLVNNSVSVFSSNCVGCCVLHDLGLQFNSPFVNLFVNAEDYMKYLRNPQKYNAMEFTELESEFPYPLGQLGDLTFHFVHYASFEQAVSAFKRRVERINYENLFVIFSEKDGCSREMLVEFDSLPYVNKVVFTHKPYENIKSAYYIKGFEKDGEVGNLVKWDRKIGRRLYDRFDFVSWFNNGKKE